MLEGRATDGGSGERLLTVADAAEITQLGEPTILRWIGEGLPHIPCASNGYMSRRGRKGIRIRESALWEWLRGMEVIRKPPPPPEPKGKGKQARPATSMDEKLNAWRKIVKMRQE
jgi:hypothetical protein